MVGDVNIFLSNEGSEVVAECEIMIAEKSSRGKERSFKKISKISEKLHD